MTFIVSDWEHGIHRCEVDALAGQGKAQRLAIRRDAPLQRIEGFGGAFTRASALLWRGLSAPMRQQALSMYFDPLVGAGYTLCRTPMGGCDFAEYAYTYDDSPDDIGLERFSIEPDLDTTIPMIKAAKALAGDDFRLYACPWSPPAWMKDSGRLEYGGRLLRAHYPTMARYFVRFLEAYSANGVPLWGISAQNEPNECLRWPTCLYSALEEAEFVGEHLIPALDAAGFEDVRVLIWDNNKDLLAQRVKETMAACARPERVWGAAFHWYAGDHFEQLDDVRRMHPELCLLSTECCTPLHDASPASPGERYAHEMIGDFLHGACGFIDWNLFLDADGGPSYVRNQCLAPLTLDGKEDRIVVNDAYDAMYHFSHFVKRGALCVPLQGCRAPLEGVAFLNPDQSVVVELLNRGDEPQRVELEGEECCVPAHGLATWVK